MQFCFLAENPSLLPGLNDSSPKTCRCCWMHKLITADLYFSARCCSSRDAEHCFWAGRWCTVPLSQGRGYCQQGSSFTAGCLQGGETTSRCPSSNPPLPRSHGDGAVYILTNCPHCFALSALGLGRADVCLVRLQT